MFSRCYVCFQPCRLEDVNVRSPTSGRKMFPRALAKRNGVVLLQDEEGGFGTLIAATVKDAFQKQRSLAVTTQEFR